MPIDTNSQKPHPDARPLDYDPVTGVTRWWIQIDEKHAAICTQTPVDGLFDRNRELYANSLSKRWGDGQVAASIPLDVYYASGYAEADKNGDDKWKKRFLNDPDNRKFRTFKGRV